MDQRSGGPTLLNPAVDPERELQDLLTAPLAVDQSDARAKISGVLTGTLVAFINEGTTPLVTIHGQSGTQALAARATLELHGAHIGRQVVMVFEEGDPKRPIVIGCLHDQSVNRLPATEDHVEVGIDGQRLIVTAKEQLVLRCGKASITLTRAGKVLIEGAYLSSRATGVNRIRGGSVQLN